jgi:hypothetical protein
MSVQRVINSGQFAFFVFKLGAVMLKLTLKSG